MQWVSWHDTLDPQLLLPLGSAAFPFDALTLLFPTRGSGLAGLTECMFRLLSPSLSSPLCLLAPLLPSSPGRIPGTTLVHFLSLSGLLRVIFFGIGSHGYFFVFAGRATGRTRD
jgi:hypothetical protein